MKTTALALLALTIASPAVALSCMAQDAVRLYEQARDSEETYVAVRGRIDLSEPAKVPDPDSEIPATTQAVISGYSLTSHGFGAIFNRTVQIEATCFGPWCGSADGFEGEQIAMLKVGEDDTYTLAADPCGGGAMNWSKDSERRLLSCHRTGNCVTAE